MGLKEKREQQSFVENSFPNMQSQIIEAAKFDVDIEVDWDSLSIEGESHLYLECWPKVYFEPIIKAFGAITTDQMGAEALKSSLKKIIIKNENDIASASRWCSFSDGILNLDHAPHANVEGSSYDERIKVLQRMLEDNL